MHAVLAVQECLAASDVAYRARQARAVSNLSGTHNYLVLAQVSIIAVHRLYRLKGRGEKKKNASHSIPFIDPTLVSASDCCYCCLQVSVVLLKCVLSRLPPLRPSVQIIVELLTLTSTVLMVFVALDVLVMLTTTLLVIVLGQGIWFNRYYRSQYLFVSCFRESNYDLIKSLLQKRSQTVLEYHLSWQKTWRHRERNF